MFLSERLVSSEPVQRAVERMEDARTRGGVDGMIKATARRVMAMKDASKLKAIELAVEYMIDAGTDNFEDFTSEQVSALRNIVKSAKEKVNEDLVRKYVSLVVEKRATTNHYKTVCKDCGDVINQCRCPGDKKVTYDICEKCSEINELDVEEDNEELEEASGCAGIAGYSLPLGMSPNSSTPKKRATWK